MIGWGPTPERMAFDRRMNRFAILGGLLLVPFALAMGLVQHQVSRPQLWFLGWLGVGACGLASWRLLVYLRALRVAAGYECGACRRLPEERRGTPEGARKCRRCGSPVELTAALLPILEERVRSGRNRCLVFSVSFAVPPMACLLFLFPHGTRGLPITDLLVAGILGVAALLGGLLPLRSLVALPERVRRELGLVCNTCHSDAVSDEWANVLPAQFEICAWCRRGLAGVPASR